MDDDLLCCVDCQSLKMNKLCCVDDDLLCCVDGQSLKMNKLYCVDDDPMCYMDGIVLISLCDLSHLKN